MATFHDPHTRFAPLEVIERLIEIRAELGFPEHLYLERTEEIMDFLDSYGFDIYSFTTDNDKMDFGLYSSPVVPGGDSVHSSLTAH
jgi:hypothetical protein